MNKSLVQQQFGAYASAYSDSAPHAKGASLARIVEVTRPQPSWMALDIATGAGHTAAAFSPLVASVIASDITFEMLTQARRLAATRGLANMTTAAVDAEAIPYPDATFDLVSCRIAAHHFTDVPRFVSEVRRVLRDGGTFALVDNISPDPLSLPGYAKAELRDADVSYNTFEKLRDPSHMRCLTLGEWLELLEDAGFEIRHREVLNKAMNFNDWLGRQQVAPEISERLEEMLRTATPALRALLKPRVVDGEQWFSVDEGVLVAVKGD